MDIRTAIRVENLSKSYRIYDSPLDRLKESLHPLRKKYHRDFFALKDVSFEIEKGHTVGIIGKNGSGKSTLLKIITGVLTPTEGRVAVNGKVSALLELGTGFNMELTGVENIYFSGTIMGYTKEEMDAKLDGILSFADIGDFVRQPLKTYSSGMYVRLAFAVATYIDPEILIVDEALAVGDMRFQQKCFRKINEFRDSGNTILFVSHDVGSIRTFCDSAMWLKDGTVFQSGEPADITREYVSFMTYNLPTAESKKSEASMPDREEEKKGRIEEEIEWEDTGNCSGFGEGGAEITRVAFYSKEPFRKLKIYESGGWVELFVEVTAKKDIGSPIIGFSLNNEYGHLILGVNNSFIGENLGPFLQGCAYVVKYEFKMPLLKNGNYTISIAVAEGTLEDHTQLHWVHDAYMLQISSDNIQNKFGHYFALPRDEVKIQATRQGLSHA